MSTRPSIKTKAKIKARTPRSYPPANLRQLQYRSYQYTIIIYHYNNYAQPLEDFKRSLSRDRNGYISNLFSKDTLTGFPVAEGDEVPENSVEVAYLPNVFQHRGSALGFRSFSKDRIEWLCFKCPVEQLINNWTIVYPGGVLRKPFDKVATLERGETGRKGTVKGHPEHRAWYEALAEAWEPVVPLRLTWNNKSRDIQEEIKRREKEEGYVFELEEKEDKDVDLEGMWPKEELPLQKPKLVAEVDFYTRSKRAKPPVRVPQPPPKQKSPMTRLLDGEYV
ncbi:hypothetical protein BU26DRAFT_563820 [Trematosphaeria pertusa]|uniref:Uncharacterized protein n=1 Tax=Trematosphaeria pertusa TaxID=390896 RepID=A0A6A6IIQ7_9PLEO|nr:uncharacterized protein BU26DRAFT_563820 [Trematosphaeria pertusa]KAF2249928.1 hypothetical protein BU26DRAFT_563820 [Trematosphaeria pertusa]